jgi:hypothetical protein
MTAKEHLQTVYTIQKKIDRLNGLRESIRADLYSLGSPSGNMDKDKVQTSKSGDKMLKLIARVDEAERDIAREIANLIKAKQTILSEIECVQNENHRQLLYERYVLCWRWEKISLEHNRGTRRTYTMHGKALESFEKVWKRAL